VRVRLPEDALPPRSGMVRVRVEDVGRADAPAPELAAAAFRTSRPAGGVLGPFELTADLPPGGQYAVRVHVDRSGDDRIAPGDLVSVARHPVEAVGDTELEVPVRPVPEDPTA
jgi:uncharacterized lipoprotein YbaY